MPVVAVVSLLIGLVLVVVLLVAVLTTVRTLATTGAAVTALADRLEEIESRTGPLRARMDDIDRGLEQLQRALPQTAAPAAREHDQMHDQMHDQEQTWPTP